MIMIEKFGKFEEIVYPLMELKGEMMMITRADTVVYRYDATI